MLKCLQFLREKISFHRLILLLLAMGCIMGEIVPAIRGGGLTTHYALYLRLTKDVFFSVGIIGGVLFYWHLLERRRWELLTIASLGTLLELALYYLRLDTLSKTAALPYIGAGWGTVAIIFIGLRWFSTPTERLQAEKALALSLVLPGFSLLNMFLSVSLSQFTDGMVYDCGLYAIDGLMGFQPSVYLARFGYSSPVLSYYLWVVYSWLSVAMLVSQLLYCLYPKQIGYSPLIAALLAGAFGQYLNSYYPCVGTFVFLGPSFPFLEHIPTISDPTKLLACDLQWSRSTIPSLHITWALLSVWATVGLKSHWRLIGLLFFLSTSLSIFNIGNHYLTDWCMAIPFSLFCLSLSLKSLRQYWRQALGGALLGGGLAGIWLFSMKHYPMVLIKLGAATWLALVLTVLASLAYMIYLYRLEAKECAEK